MPRHSLRWTAVSSVVLLSASCASMADRSARSHEGGRQVAGAMATTANLGRTAFRATAVATLRQPVTSLKTGSAIFWHRSREVLVGNVPVSMSLDAVPEHRPGSEAFERFLDDEGLPKRELGSVSCLIDGEGYFSELDRQIRTASSSIDFQTYIFDNDDVGCRYAKMMGERSASVPVRVMFDDMGTHTALISPPLTPAPDGFVPPDNMKSCLQEDSEVRVRMTLNPWLVVDHTKLAVFDGRTALLGGMNMGREYFSEWHDLMMKVEGPVVGSLQREFNEAWRKAGPWGDLSGLMPKRRIVWPEARPGDVPLRILRTDAAAGRLEVLKATVAAIRASRERVWIENPYFASDDVMHAVRDAAGRGVDVRVILPEENDSALMQLSNAETARNLMSGGAKVYLYPGMTHLKAMICDGWASVGSANFDTLSMRINRELNIAFSDRASVRELERELFLPDLRKSRRMKESEAETPLGAIVESLADQL